MAQSPSRHVSSDRVKDQERAHARSYGVMAPGEPAKLISVHVACWAIIVAGLRGWAELVRN